MHMAIGAVVNAALGPRGRRLEGQPLWHVLVSTRRPRRSSPRSTSHTSTTRVSPPRRSPSCTSGTRSKRERIDVARGRRLPGVHHICRLARLRRRRRSSGSSRQAVADGFTMIKLKVGADVSPTCAVSGRPALRSATTARIAVDANQRWGVEPGDRVDGRPRRVRARTGSRSPRHPTTCSGTQRSARRSRRSGSRPASTCRTGSIFKQLLQAEAIDVVQIDACRVGGVNENLAILLLAAKFGVPVCPHAGGVGLCEMVQHLAMFDFVAVSGTIDGSLDRVRRPPARALHRSGVGRGWAIPGAHRSGRRCADARRFDRRAPVSRWSGVGRVRVMALRIDDLDHRVAA